MKRLLLGVVLCLGCGPSGGGSDGGLVGGSGGASSAPGVSNPGAPADEDAVMRYAREWCAYYTRCDFPSYADNEECVEATACMAREIVAGSSLTRGGLLSCSSFATNLGCAEIPLMPNACSELIASLSTALGVEPGCDGEQCEVGSYCDRSDDLCPHCEQRAAVGESCEGTTCIEDAYCNFSTLRCEPTRGEGAACDTHNQCLSGRYDWRTWLFCRDGVCTKPAELGEPCTDALDCGIYLRCVGGVCSQRAREGEACAEPIECSAATTCIQGTCVKVCGLQREGEPCNHDGLCVDSFCDDATTQCAARRPAGASCSKSTACEPELFCEETTATCTPRAVDGTACLLDEECVSQRCSNRVCAEPICN